MPLTGRTTYTDMVFGEIAVDNKELTDQILLKADNYPTYNFAHVVDDYLMGVTHVVRGSEYLSSTPKYALLYDAFGWPRPNYVHLPLLMGMNEDGTVSKLSKRHGAVSFQDLCGMGYLPEAIVNYIAFLGWSPKDTNKEIFTLNELQEVFSIDGINKSPAVFDYNKLLWFNGEYIRMLSPEEFARSAEGFLTEEEKAFPKIGKILSLIQPRIGALADIREAVRFFFELPDYDTDLYVNKKNKTTVESCLKILTEVRKTLESTEDWNNDALYAVLKDKAAEMDIKAGAVMWAVRVAVSGLAVTPGGATELMEVLGKDTSLERIDVGIGKLR